MNKKKNKIKYSFEDKAYFTISGIILSLLLISVSYPLIYVLSASFSSAAALNAGKVVLLPVDFCLDGYEAVLGKSDVWKSYGNTIIYTVSGTFLNVTMAMITAYPMAMRGLKGKNGIMMFFSFTMFFSGGMIPSYLLMNDLHLLDNPLAVIIPGALSVYNMIIARTFIQSNIPHELYEASSIDGCGYARFFISMVLPLSKAILAVLALFSAITHWNSYFSAMLYLNDRSLMPLQLILREILVLNQIDYSTVTDPDLMLKLMNSSASLKYSLIVVSTVPILCVYPFAQKYFIKGVMIGSIKG